MEKVSVLIANWNGNEVIRPLLDSILRQDYLNREIIVVDDASTDGSDDVIEREYPTIQLIRNTTNLGFAATNKTGFDHCTGQYLLTLNNDIELIRDDFISTLVRAIESGPSIGSVAVKLIFADQKQVINNAGIEILENGNARNRGKGCAIDEYSGGELIFGASAGAALYSKPALDQIGFFDESYGAYLEDVDLAWRLQLAGFQCWYEPGASAFHIHSLSYGGDKERKLRLIFGNSFRNLIKYYPLKYILGEAYYTIRIYFAEKRLGRTVGNQLGVSGLKLFKCLLTSRIGVLGSLVQLLRKRRTIHRISQTPPTAILQDYLSKS